MTTLSIENLCCRIQQLESKVDSLEQGGTAYTVATLPTVAQGATLGDHAYVTDATSPTYNGALTGGGAVKVPVFFNGTAWVSH
jgi:hypothetical protein